MATIRVKTAIVLVTYCFNDFILKVRKYYTAGFYPWFAAVQIDKS